MEKRNRPRPHVLRILVFGRQDSLVVLPQRPGQEGSGFSFGEVLPKGPFNKECGELEE